MRIASLEFSPSLWPTLAFFLILPLFIYLGFWQLSRAEQKRVLQDDFNMRQLAPPVDLNGIYDLDKKFAELHWRKVKMQGTFAEDMNILLDNQVVNGVAGYFVYTPFKLEQYQVWVLVNRGWVATGERRDNVPDVNIGGQQVLDISGSVKSLPRTGILLAENRLEQIGDGVYRLQKLVLDDIEVFTQLQFLPYVVRLDPVSAAGFSRVWAVPGSGEQKHLGYAFQWFAMAVAVLFIYLVLNVRRLE